MKPSIQHGRSPSIKNIQCRPTRLGMGLFILIFLLWLVGVNYQANLAYIAAFWLLGFIIIAVLLNFRQLLALQIDVDMPNEVFVGQNAELLLTSVHNKRRRQLWLCSEEDYLNHEMPSENIWHQWQTNSDGIPFRWHIPANQRGYLQVPPLRTASIAPFGITIVQCVWHWPSNAVVFPAPMEHNPPDAHANSQAEILNLRPVAGGEELAYLQPHQDGMSLQHIAWKTFAKTGEMLSKRFEEPQPIANSNYISYRDYPAGTATDRLASLLCYRVLQAEKHHIPYTLELPQRTITPQHGQREMCLTALALW